MCGRYYVDDTFTEELNAVVKHHGITIPEGLLDPLMPEDLPKEEILDLHPTERPLILAKGTLSRMHWGYRGMQQLVINARSETAAEKRMFRESLQTKRCLIPASGFYEWDHDRNKVTFTGDQGILFMAGLYRMYQGEQEFVILTTAANESMIKTHDRMPCFISEKEIDVWLGGDLKEEQPGRVMELLHKRQPQLQHSQSYEQLSLFDL